MDEGQIDSLISQLSLAQKIALCGCGLNLSITALQKQDAPQVNLPRQILEERDDMAGLGCTFDLELATQKGKIINNQAVFSGAREAGILNLGIIREPMQDGSQKMLGEDSFAVSQMAKAIVEGSQAKIIASGILGGEYSFAERNIDERALIELYMRPFISVANKLGGVVLPAGSINGKLVCESSILKTIAEYLPQGIIINEFGSVNNAAECLKAGALFEVGSYSLADVDLQLNNKTLDVALLNSNVKRILNYLLLPFSAKVNTSVTADEFNKNLAQESIVLLKNDTQLPLALGAKIGVFGDITKAESLVLSQSFEVNFNKFGDYPAVVFLRLDGNDYIAAQNQIVDSCVKNCSGVIVVLLANRPAPLHFESEANAILYCPQINDYTLTSVAKIVCGQQNPCGKLNVTYAYSPLDYPAKMYAKASDRGMFCYESVLNGYRYFSSFNRGVLYPFGHGLSYTGFEILDCKSQLNGSGIDIDFSLKNSGMMAGVAVVFVFGCLLGGDVLGLKTRLGGFKRAYVKKESQISLHMTVELSAFSVYNLEKREWIIPAKILQLYLGFSCGDKRAIIKIKLPNYTRKSYDLTSKKIPSYFTSDAFNPLGIDVEKVVKTPLLVRQNPYQKYCQKTTSVQADKQLKLCAKKLCKTSNLKLPQAVALLNSMSDYAVNKILES